MTTYIIGSGSHARMLRALTQATLAIDAVSIANDDRILIGVGNIPTVGHSGLEERRQIYFTFQNRIESYYDPDSIPRAKSYGAGVQHFARAVTNTESVIGNNTIINTGAIVEHDCTVGNHCHIAPGAILLGGVRVGDLVHVGAGAIILPGITIGHGAVIAAGATVMRDVPAGATYISPTRLILAALALNT